MDKFEIGDQIVRHAPSGKPVAALYVSNPNAHVTTASFRTESVGHYSWYMIASQVGVWHLAWFLADGTVVQDEIEVCDELLY